MPSDIAATLGRTCEIRCTGVREITKKVLQLTRTGILLIVRTTEDTVRSVGPHAASPLARSGDEGQPVRRPSKSAEHPTPSDASPHPKASMFGLPGLNSEFETG